MTAAQTKNAQRMFSDQYKAVDPQGIIRAEGSLRTIKALVKRNGGRAAGWFIGVTHGKSIGEPFDTASPSATA